MLLNSSILDSQSVVLHKNGTEFHQEFNGSIHIYLVPLYGVVQYTNSELKYTNVVLTQFLILPAPDILLVYKHADIDTGAGGTLRYLEYELTRNEKEVLHIEDSNLANSVFLNIGYNQKEYFGSKMLTKSDIVLPAK